MSAYDLGYDDGIGLDSGYDRGLRDDFIGDDLRDREFQDDLISSDLRDREFQDDLYADNLRDREFTNDLVADDLREREFRDDLREDALEDDMYRRDLDRSYRDDAYDHGLFGSHYSGADDYYGSYGDLMAYEENLRLQRDITEDERLSRWQNRLAFEELGESERLRRWELMNEEERLRLGLRDSYWGSRYSGRGIPGGSWRHHYGNRLGRWGPGRLPLSSGLFNRYGRIWGRRGMGMGEYDLGGRPVGPTGRVGAGYGLGGRPAGGLYGRTGPRAHEAVFRHRVGQYV